MTENSLSRRRFLAQAAAAGSAAAGAAIVGGCTVSAGSASSAANSGAAVSGSLTIAQWTNPPAVKVTQELNAAFQREHPDVKVTLRTAPNPNNGYGALTSSLLASKSVDIIAQFPLTPAAFPPGYTGQKTSNFAALVAAGKIVDLTDQPFMKQYDKTQQTYAYGYKGRLYGLMAAEYAAYGGLFYKKQLLQKHGIDIPQNWDQFMSALQTLKSAGMSPIFVPAKDGYEAFIWTGILDQTLMAGKDSADAAKVGAQQAEGFWKGELKWTDSLYQQVASKYEMVMNYVEPGAGGVAALTAAGVWAVKDDDYPFMVDGTFDVQTIQEANPKLEFGFFTFPSSNDPAVNRVILNPDLTWVVPSSAPNKPAAMAWLEFFSRPANYQRWLAATSSNSTQPSINPAGGGWRDWLYAHKTNEVPTLQGVWVPTGAAPEAGGPVLANMKPLGNLTATAELQKCASTYSRARKL